MRLSIHQLSLLSLRSLLWQQRPKPLPFPVPFSGGVFQALALMLLPHRSVLWVVLQPVAESLTGLPVQRFVREADSQSHQSSQVVVLQLDASNEEKVFFFKNGVKAWISTKFNLNVQLPLRSPTCGGR